MDLIALAPSKEPVFLQLQHPVERYPLFKQMPDPEFKDSLAEGEMPPMVDNPNEPIGLYIVGSDSEEFAARERWLIDQRIKRSEARRQGNKAVTLVKSELLEEETINTLVACVKGFRNVELNGRKLEHLPNDARLLLTTLKWVREFLDREIVNRANFIKG